MVQPIQWDQERNEPFIQLPSPLETIVLTPPRLDDNEPILAIVSHPSVQKWLATAMNEEKASAWARKFKAEADKVIGGMTHWAPGDAMFDPCPLRSIRETLADKTQVYIGDIGFQRCQWKEMASEEDRTSLVTANEARPAGDPMIVWQVAGEIKSAAQRLAKVLKK